MTKKASGGIDANGQRVMAVAAPETDTDAATKGYVDSRTTGGTPPKIETFDSSGTWIKDPLAKTVRVFVQAPGGGGASGSRGASGAVVRGGGPGGPGGHNFAEYNAADLPANVPIFVGAPGTGGASLTADGAGLSGGAGGEARFGGSGIAASITAGGGGGGSASSAGTAGRGRVTITAGSASNAAGGSGGSVVLSNLQSSSGGAGGGQTTTPGNYNGGRVQTLSLDFNEAFIGTAGVGSTKTDAVGPTTRFLADHSIYGGGGPGGWCNADGTAGAGANGLAGGGGGGGGAAIGNPSGAGGNGGAGRVVVVSFY